MGLLLLDRQCDRSATGPARGSRAVPSLRQVLQADDDAARKAAAATRDASARPVRTGADRILDASPELVTVAAGALVAICDQAVVAPILALLATPGSR